VHLGGSSLQQTLAHQSIQRAESGFGRVEQFGIHARHGDTQSFDFVAMRSVPLGTGDVLPIDHRHGLAFFDKAVVAIDTKEHEGRKNEQEQQDLHDPVVLADEIKHA